MPSPTGHLHLQITEYRAKDGRSAPADRGTLAVPLSRERPDTGRAELAFVRLPALDPHPARVPVIFLTGGPGLSAIASGRGRLFDFFAALRSTGDVILLDQRGCGESVPLLRCDAPLRIPLDRAVTRHEFNAAAADAMRRCVAALTAQGIDVAAFNSNESADDVAALAQALGYARVNLLGWSYGSHLAMAVMRRHRQIVHRAVLAGPEGPDQTWKLPSRVHAQLDRLSAAAGFDATQAVRAALERAGRRAVRIPWGDGTTAAIGGFDVEWVLSEAIADTRVLKRLPPILAEMAAGDVTGIARDPVLRGIFEEFRGGLFQSPLRYCVDCASGASPERQRRIEREAEALPLGRTIDWPCPEICAAVGSPDLGGTFRAPLRSDVPVLFITGTLDCRTPGDNARDLAPDLLSPRHLTVDGAGHGDLLLPRAVHAAVTEFLRSGNLETAHVPMPDPFVPERPRATLVFDGECAFCRSRAQRLSHRAGGGLALIPYQEIGARLDEIPREQFARTVHLVTPEGRVLTGAEAILQASAFASRLGRLLLAGYRHVPGFRLVAEAGYRLIARNRAHLS
ncbi:MAG TPA: alpha/beta fold hydrolase [Candidatus Krumholzibacteria bacterium]|nr:alpha/beta fold hydrolase [Candidatus Krumholzibacteria bacterium]